MSSKVASFYLQQEQNNDEKMEGGRYYKVVASF
jgi:hypothetical protein